MAIKSEKDLIFRTKELNEFLDEAAVKYEFDRDNVIAIGYSNGANIAAGTNDPICSPLESEELQTLLEKANAEVVLHWDNRGHQLTREEVEAAAQWYRNL
jgi:phospholipase/carboxylesterase